MTPNLRQQFEEEFSKLTREYPLTVKEILTFIKAELESLAEEIDNNPQMRVPDQQIAAAIIRNRAKEIGVS